MRINQVIRCIETDDSSAVFIGLQIWIPINSGAYVGFIVLFRFGRFVHRMIKFSRFTQYIYKMQTTPNKVIINKL